MDKEPNLDKFIYLASVFRDAAYGAQRLAHALMSVATSVRDAKELPERWQDNDPLREREENEPEPIEDPWDRPRPSNPPPFNPFQPPRSEEPSDYAGQRQMNHELDAYDNLMGNFSFTIDQAMRKIMDGQPEPMRTSAMITVFASYLLGSLNECQSTEVRQEWTKIVMDNLRGLGPPEN